MWVCRDEMAVGAVGRMNLAINNAGYEENKTESPILILLCILCFQRQPFRFFIVHMLFCLQN